jgi:hypothetical protein
MGVFCSHTSNGVYHCSFDWDLGVVYSLLQMVCITAVFIGTWVLSIPMLQMVYITAVFIGTWVIFVPYFNWRVSLQFSLRPDGCCLFLYFKWGVSLQFSLGSAYYLRGTISLWICFHRCLVQVSLSRHGLYLVVLFEF